MKVTLGDSKPHNVLTIIKHPFRINLNKIPKFGTFAKSIKNEERKVTALKNAIQEGIDSGIAHDFDLAKNLEELKAGQAKNG
jgi:antitoxin ParD1/3/4